MVSFTLFKITYVLYSEGHATQQKVFGDHKVKGKKKEGFSRVSKPIFYECSLYLNFNLDSYPYSNHH